MITKRFIPSLALVAVFIAAQLVAQAPAGAPAGATGLCNDGTYYTGAKKQGACHGHKGVKEWYGTSAVNKAGTPAANAGSSDSTSAGNSSSGSSATTSAATPKASAKTPAPGGSPDKVWLNTATNVYHCPGTRYYGTTKAGAYMSEDEAKAKGGRPDHGKACK
ncbi:MAG: DUF3761 domain-containing protein [Acidobacteria bacterium]|nr:DUF3761 domain-containing protein [Acidobacteriota bacterium]